MDHLADGDPVIADDTEILRHADAVVRQFADGAQAAEVVRTEHAGGALFFRQQLPQDTDTAFGIVKSSDAHIVFRDPDAQGRADLVVSRQPFPAYGALLAGDEGDPAVPPAVSIPDEQLHAGAVICAHTVAAVVHVVDDHRGDRAGGEPDDAGGIEIRLDDDDSVQVAPAGVLVIIIIGILGVIPADDGQIVTADLRLPAQGIHQGREIFMIQPVFIQDADVVGSAGLQGAGGGIGIIAHLLRGMGDQLRLFTADGRHTVQRPADRCNRNAACVRDILHRDHCIPPLFPKYLMQITQSIALIIIRNAE